jgi:regulatory protein
MAGTVTAITAQKRTADRVNIYIDDQYGFSLSCRTAAALQQGDILTPEHIQLLKDRDRGETAFLLAVKYLSFRARSRAEVGWYLEARGYSPDEICEVLHRLESCNYINDTEFARTWIENRLRHRPRGAYGLKWELRRKGVAEATIASSLDGFDESEAARRALISRLRRWEALPVEEIRRKTYAFLRRRGFAGETCREIWEALEKERTNRA